MLTMSQWVEWLTAVPNISRVRIVMYCILMPYLRYYLEPMLDSHSVFIISTSCIVWRLVVLASLALHYMRLKKSHVPRSHYLPYELAIADGLKGLTDVVRTLLARLMLGPFVDSWQLVGSVSIILMLYEWQVTLTSVAAVLFFSTLRFFGARPDAAVEAVGWDPVAYAGLCFGITPAAAGDGVSGNREGPTSAAPRESSIKKASAGAKRCEVVDEGPHYGRPSARGCLLNYDVE